MGKIHKIYFEKQETGYKVTDFTGTSIDSSFETFFSELGSEDKKFILEISNEKFNGSQVIFLDEVKVEGSEVCGVYLGSNPSRDNISEIRLPKYFHDIFNEYPQCIYYRKFFSVR